MLNYVMIPKPMRSDYDLDGLQGLTIPKTRTDSLLAQDDILSRARAIDKVNKGTNRDFCPKRSSSIVYYNLSRYGHLSIAIAGDTPCSVSLGSDYRDAGNGPTAFGTLDAGFFVSLES